ncbi:hypothetical protein Pcinc_042419, partial [Petrolisthes cinctipes]
CVLNVPVRGLHPGHHVYLRHSDRRQLPLHLSQQRKPHQQDDPEVGSITSFETLKRAHITRSKTSRTSFYLRVGALVFGLGTVYIPTDALLFVNSEVIVEKFGQIARFGFMHLVATNIAVWVRMVVWESAVIWIEDSYANKGPSEIPEQAEQVLRLYTCFNNNSLGRLWTDAQPYLFPSSSNTA